MRVPSGLLADIDFDAVVAAELKTRNRYLPPNIADRALRPYAGEVAGWFRTVLGRDFIPLRQDVVLARKVGGGSRPLPFLGLRERLAYRALTGLVAEVGDGRRGNHAEFREAPLSADEADCRYVLKTDVAAFYQYVDHERLVDEVVAQTGDDLAISAAIELMQASSERRFGLPQMSAPSDALAEIYIDPMRRALVRAGYTVWRFADDFRVACPDYPSALAALELCERSAFSLGLVLNESKTSTPRRDTYEASLSEVAGAEQELFALAHDESALPVIPVDSELLTIENFFLLGVEDYDDDESLGDLDEDDEDSGLQPDDEDPPAPEPPSERQVTAATYLLEMWEDHRKDNRSDDDVFVGVEWSRSAWSILLRKALTVLTNAEDETGLEYVSSLLVYEPDLTPQVCWYLKVLADSAQTGVVEVLDVVCDRQVVSAWQSLWIAYCASAVGATRSNVEATHVTWLRDRLRDPHGSVAAQAALTLAQRRLLSVAEATETYERVPAVHRQTAFLAVAAAYGQQGEDVPVDDQIEKFLGSWVHGQGWGRPVKTLTRPKKRAIKKKSTKKRER